MSLAEPEINASFIAEFLDDYFAESEEHLIVLRRGLLALEGSVNQPAVERSLLDELFRSFHSLKGISAMVGLRAAEQLAHHLESFLRALRDGQARLTTQGLDSLILGTRTLEEVIAARRDQRPPPDIAAVVAELEELAATPVSAEPLASAAEAAIEATAQTAATAATITATAAAADAPRWRCEFTPQPQLAARGVNINVVRARLQELGDLQQSTPRVLSGGGIAFEFIVASQAAAAAFAALAESGVTATLITESAGTTDKEAPATDDVRVEQEGAALTPTGGAAGAASVVRVSLGRLDELMRLVGELVISRARLEERVQAVEALMPAPQWRGLQETAQLFERQLRDLRDGVMRVRMVPVGEIFERMRFVVRDLARESVDKQIALHISGQETEIDKLLVERMTDPLMHLVRNAVSHGLESVGERRAAGKPEVGTIALRAATVAEMVVIEIEDDGRGIVRERVFERARELGLLAEGEALADGDSGDDAALLELLCSPGFSTRREADRASGRGVGMEVVKNTVQGLGGVFTLQTTSGRGTRFTIQLPVTLAIAEALIVALGEQRYAAPQSAVREVFAVEAAAIKRFENNEVIQHRDSVLPLVRLARRFGLPCDDRRAAHVLVVGNGLHRAGIVVDRILGQREIVVRAITDPLLQVQGISGATELGDGRVVLILDVGALMRQ